MSTYDDVLEIFGVKSEPKEQKGSGGRKFAPDGEGVAVIKEAGNGANTKGPYIFWKLYYPEYQSEEWAYNNIDHNNTGAMRALAAQFGSLGIKPDSSDADDLGAAAARAVGWTVKVEKISKKGDRKNKEGKDVWWRNFRFKSVVSKSKEEATTDVMDDDSIPF